MTQRDRMLYLLVTMLNESADTVENDTTWTCLDQNGITNYDDFKSLSDDDIMGLTYTVNNELLQLPLITRRKMVIARLYHMWVNQQSARDIQIEELGTAGFDVYRVNFYEDHANAVKRGSKGEGNLDLERWNKGIKANRTEYPTLSGAELWIRFKEDFCSTADSQGLLHTLVDNGYTVTNPELFAAQMKWMHKTLKDKINNIIARGIIRQHEDTKNSRNAWSDLCAHFDNGFTATIHAQKLVTYVSSAKLKTSWRGTQAGFISHFSEQLRVHAKVDPAGAYSESQKINLLRLAVSDTENLAIIHNVEQTTRRAAHVTDPWIYEDYAQALTIAAEMYDSKNAKKASVSGIAVNNHELIFDDGSTAIEPADAEVMVHDFNTSVDELMAFQAQSNYPPDQKVSRNGRPILLDQKTYQGLSRDDRLHWNQISNDGILSIAEYLKGKGSSNQKGSPIPNGEAQRKVFMHERAPPDLLDSGTPPNQSIEVKNHTLTPCPEHGENGEPEFDIRKFLTNSHSVSRGDVKPHGENTSTESGPGPMTRSAFATEINDSDEWQRAFSYEISMHDQYNTFWEVRAKKQQAANSNADQTNPDSAQSGAVEEHKSDIADADDPKSEVQPDLIDLDDSKVRSSKPASWNPSGMLPNSGTSVIQDQEQSGSSDFEILQAAARSRWNAYLANKKKADTSRQTKTEKNVRFASDGVQQPTKSGNLTPWERYLLNKKQRSAMSDQTVSTEASGTQQTDTSKAKAEPIKAKPGTTMSGPFSNVLKPAVKAKDRMIPSKHGFLSGVNKRTSHISHASESSEAQPVSIDKTVDNSGGTKLTAESSSTQRIPVGEKGGLKDEKIGDNKKANDNQMSPPKDESIPVEVDPNSEGGKDSGDVVTTAAIYTGIPSQLDNPGTSLQLQEVDLGTCGIESSISDDTQISPGLHGFNSSIDTDQQVVLESDRSNRARKRNKRKKKKKVRAPQGFCALLSPNKYGQPSSSSSSSESEDKHQGDNTEIPGDDVKTQGDGDYTKVMGKSHPTAPKTMLSGKPIGQEKSSQNRFDLLQDNEDDGDQLKGKAKAE